jgi:5S rRNA maturation endonuclease (ribonuclease M5)
MDLQKIKNNLNSRAEEVFSRLGMDIEVLGDNIYCNCPVHEGSDNPRAFSFSKDKGIWKCWTRDCQQQYRNDIFGIIRGHLSRQNGIDVGFSEALRWSCNFLNIKKTKQIVIPEVVKEDDFTKLVNTITRENSIVKSCTPIELDECVDIPSKYFLSRGFKAETLNHFQVGDCYDRSSKLYDRSVIPIHNDDGTSIIACIARANKEYKHPKFLITPKGFDKRHFFYNYHRAAQSIKETSSLVLVEGQSDVWRLHEAGITQCMSIFGRTLSKEQELKLSTLPLTHIVILLDNDQAGRESKVQIQRQLNRLYKLSFPKIPTKDIGEMTIEQIKKQVFPQIKGILNG